MYNNAKCWNDIMPNVSSRYKHEKEVVEKDLSLIKQELEEIKKVNEGGPRSPTRYINKPEHEEHCGSVVECLTRDRGACRFEPHQRHCVVFLSKTNYPLLSTISTLKDPSQQY